MQSVALLRNAGSVAPFTGAWIEILDACVHLADDLVAPFTGAWIEIQLMNETVPTPRSLPLRERGLKFPLGG